MGCHSHFRDWYAGFNNTNVERWNSAAFIVYPKLVASNRRTDEPLHENQKQTMDGERRTRFPCLEKTNLVQRGACPYLQHLGKGCTCQVCACQVYAVAVFEILLDSFRPLWLFRELKFSHIWPPVQTELV